jgi:hypothetical protein
MILLNGPHIKYIIMTVVMNTKINLAIIAVVAAVGLVTAGSFATTALAVKKIKGLDEGTGTSSSDSSSTGLLGTSSLPANYNMPHKASKPNSDLVANSDQAANPSKTIGSGKGSDLLANSDQGSTSGKSAGSNKELAKLQSCISKAAKGSDGLSRSLVDTCYDQTFYGDYNSQASSKGSSSNNYGDYNSQASSKGSSSNNEASNTGQQFNPRY